MEVQMGEGGSKGVRCGEEFSDDKRWGGIRSMWSSKHSFIGDLPYLWLLRVSLRQKLQNGLSINFLLQNNFKHNKYKKEECHAPYISSFGISNYKTNLLVPRVVIDWRLCNIKVVAKWVPSKDIHDLQQVFLFLLCPHLWWGKGRKKRENKREKEEKANPIMRDHHQNPMSTFVPLKGPTS